MLQSGHESAPRPATAPRGGGDPGRIVPLSGRERAEGRARPCVLMVAPQPFFRVTGTPINVLMMCRALTRHGFKVCLLTLPYGEDPALAGLVLQRVARLPFTEVPIGFSFAKVCYNFLLAGSLLRLLATRRFAIVHAIEEAALYAAPLARLFGVAAITDLDSDLCGQLRAQESRLVRALARPARWLRRGALRRSAGVLTVARHLSEIVRAEGPLTPIFEIPDIPLEHVLRPPDPARMAAYRAELDFVGKRPVVYTGNYDRRQGLAELLRAMPAVLQRHADAVLLVVGGEAHEVRALQALADALGLAAAVRLIGRRPPETMAEFMGLAAVLVSPRLEPFATPLKIFSYMASGRPIVATDLPTHTQVLGPEAAILVPPTPEGLASGIVRALDDPKQAACRAAQAKGLVEERYTYAVFEGKLIAAYEAILEGQAREAA